MIYEESPMPLVDRYTRRDLPAGADSRGFWSTELQNIQRGIDAAAGTPLTPGVFGDATHSAQVTVGSDGKVAAISQVPISAGGGGTTTWRNSDVSTTGSGYGASVSTGLTQAIAVSETWHLRWTLFVRRPGGANTNGVSLWFATAPSASAVRLLVLEYANSASLNPWMFASVPSGTPAAIAVGMGMNPVPGAGGAPCVLDLFIRNVTAPSTVDVHFAPDVGTETAVVLDGSFLVAEKL
jgi:hypothetical protein